MCVIGAGAHAHISVNGLRLLTIGLPKALNDSFGGFNRVNILYVSKFLANERPRNSTANSNFFSAIAFATAWVRSTHSISGTRIACTISQKIEKQKLVTNIEI